MRLMTLNLSARAAEPVRRGHPWVFREQLDATAPEGEEVRLAMKGVVLARGIASQGPIAVRVWTHGDLAVDVPLFRARLASAVALRKKWFEDSRTDAYRVVHGEGDRMPGLVVDRYGPPR